MNKRGRSLLKNTTILGFGTLCTKGIMFFMTPLFTRWLTSNEYGMFDLFITYVTLMVPVLTLATGEAIFRFLLENNDENNEKTILSTTFFLDIIGIIISIVLATLAVIFFKVDKIVVVSFISYLTTEIFYNFSMMTMRGEKKLTIYSLGNILFVVGLAFFVYIFVSKFNFGLSGILFGYACGDLIAILTIFITAKLYKKINYKYISTQTLKEMIKYSLPMIPNSISWWIVNVSDRTLISIFCGASYNAIYAVANKVPALCTTFFSVFHLSWQQNATESLKDKDRDKYYSSVFNNMIKVVGSICVMIMGVNFLFFKLFTAEYQSGYYQVPVLVVAILFSMMGQFIGGIYVAQMKSKKNGLTTMLAAIINIIINVLLIKKIGLYAASISTLISYMILFIVRYFDIKREIKLELNHKSILLFATVIYFFITAYINSLALNYINFIIGLLFFSCFNYDYLKQLLYKVNKKFRSKN